MSSSVIDVTSKADWDKKMEQAIAEGKGVSALFGLVASTGNSGGGFCCAYTIVHPMGRGV